MPGLYRVYYTTPWGDGFYAINAVDQEDALRDGKRLASKYYGDDARVTSARWMRFNTSALLA